MKNEPSNNPQTANGIKSIVSGSDIVSFNERKEFPHDIAVRVKGLDVAKLRARGNGWNLETLDIIHSFWMGGVMKQFATLDEAKAGTIKWMEQWWNR